MNTLYCFITHQRNILNSHPRITQMMQQLGVDDYLVCYGGAISDYDINTKILQLRCNDYYEGLPEKVVCMFNFLNNSPLLNKYDRYIKLDEDITIHKIIPDTKILDDYCGYVFTPDHLNRYYHMGKCSPNSKFKDTPFEGEAAKSWCLGGNGYILSNKAMSLVSQDTDYYNEIYEDMYVAKILKRNDIDPKDFPNRRHYFSSPHH